jgi:murein L,D-transpeptidase YcbB/YkuD
VTSSIDRFRPARREVLKMAAALGLVGFTPRAVAAQTFPSFSLALAEGIASDPGLSTFYRETGYAPVWTGADHAARRAALVTALSQAGGHGLPVDRYDLDGLIAAYHDAGSERDRGFLEARTSQVFVRYARDIGSGVLEPGEIIEQIVRTLPRPDVAELMRGFVAAEPMGFIRNLAPSTPEYARLHRAIFEMKGLIARGGWGPRVGGGTLRPGDTGAQVVLLRNRLMEMGYLSRTALAQYDHRLQGAVAAFQASHGIEASGIAGEATINALNVPAEDRLKSMVVALERERWLNMPRGQRHIWVNLADFTTQIMDNDLVTLDTVSIIGSQPGDMQTPEFSHRMTYLEVNPDWTLPRSIIARSYWNSLAAGGANHLQIIDNAGRVVPRSSIDFSRYNARNFPYNLRQPPGPTNPLGTVKFMFPNPWAIYLHDSPERNLFRNTQRTFSAGCIRLNDPHDFAYELLSRQSSDPVGLFQSTLRSRQQTRIFLDDPVPVHLEYRTAFTTARGQVNFRNDIYRRDERLHAALERAGAVVRAG